MRHETLKTEPRGGSAKRRIKVERKPEAPELYTETKSVAEKKDFPRITDMFENMERMMEDAWHRPMFGFVMPMFRNMLPDFRGIDNVTPAVDMYEENGSLIVKAEIPGVDKNDLDVSLEGRTLTITGKREKEEKIDKKGYVRVERNRGTFTRMLTLPEVADTENVEANLKDGVLVLRFSEIESGKKTKTIHVN